MAHRNHVRSADVISAVVFAMTANIASAGCVDDSSCFVSAAADAQMGEPQPVGASDDHEQPVPLDAIIECSCCTEWPADTVTYEAVPAGVLDALMAGNEDGFTGAPLVFPLPDGRAVYGEIVGGFNYPLGGWYAWGVLDDAESGFFAVASKEGALFASLHYGDMFYGLRKPSRITAPNGEYRVEFSSTKIGQADHLQQATWRVQTEQAPLVGTNTIIDHMYVYSSDFEEELGDFDGDGTPGTRADGVARVMVTIAELNTIYLDSAINITARLAYVYPSDIASTTLPLVTLGALSNDQDGVIDEIHLVRDLVMADLGTYKRWVEGEPAGSRAHLYNTQSSRWLNIGGYNDQVTGGGNAHETGHLMGMVHGRNRPEEPHESIPYAYSHCLPIAMQTTIMVNVSCITGQFQGLLRQYSNPDLAHPITNEALGIDHDIDPDNSADGARAHNATAGIVAGFRTGTPQYPDCDGDEILDIIEIYQGTAEDCNGNGIDDVCDIANGTETDCDSNGVPDSCELGALGVSETRSRNFWQQTTGETFDFTGIPAVESALTITVATGAAFDGVTSIDVYVDSQLAGSIFVNDPVTAPCDTRSATLVYAGHSGSVSEVELVINGGALHITGGGGCSAKIDVTLDYLVTAAGDVNRNGVYDPCEPGCSPYDIELPYGSIDFFDLSLWATWYSDGDLRADYAAPYGVLDTDDYAAFLTGIQMGCP